MADRLNKCEVVASEAVQYSFRGCRIPWKLPICEWSLTFYVVVGQFTAAGGTGSCLLRYMQCQAGPTQGRESSLCPMSAIPSHSGKSTVVREHGGMVGGDGNQHLLSSCYAPTLVNVYISSFTRQQPWEAGKSWRCPKWLPHSQIRITVWHNYEAGGDKREKSFLVFTLYIKYPCMWPTKVSIPHIWVNVWYLFFFSFWPISLYMTDSRSIPTSLWNLEK